MADFSVSLHEDDSFNLDHDNIKYLSKNIDPERVSENISYAGNIPLREFYEQTFQASYEEYRAKKTKERGKTFTANWPEKYYDSVAQKQAEEDEKLRKAKLDGKHGSELADKKAYTKIAKQIIIQIGNTDDLEAMGPEEQKKTREAMIGALKEYMDTFQKENPNFRIVNAVVHVDEISLAPHLHLTYVPVVEQKRGQHISNSLRGALKQMGFVDQPKTETAPMVHCQTLWQTKERERVIEIAGRHGLDVGYQKGNKGRGQTIGEYRAAKQAEREATREQLQIDAQNEALDRREAQVAEQEEQLDHRETVVQKKEQRIEAKVEQVNTFLQQHKERVDEANQALDEREAAIEEREQILQAEAEASVTSLKNEISEVTASLRPSPGKRVEEYPAAPLKKGHRIVPDKDLDVLVERSWFSLPHIKKSVDQIIDKFNDLPFVQSARNTIFELEQKVLELKRTIKSLKKKNKEQEVLLDKAKELKIDTFGKSMYDRLVEEVAKDRERVSEMYDHEDDRSGR